MICIIFRTRTKIHNQIIFENLILQSDVYIRVTTPIYKHYGKCTLCIAYLLILTYSHNKSVCVQILKHSAKVNVYLPSHKRRCQTCDLFEVDQIYRNALLTKTSMIIALSLAGSPSPHRQSAYKLVFPTPFSVTTRLSSFSISLKSRSCLLKPITVCYSFDLKGGSNVTQQVNYWTVFFLILCGHQTHCALYWLHIKVVVLLNAI